MKFSIVVPIYNKEKYLQRCLNSLLLQQYQDFEVVLIDDGSTDNSGDIAKNYINGDRRFRYFYQTNKGVSFTRNRGIDLSKGEYIIFIDADDEIRADFLLNLFTEISGNEYYDIYIYGLTKLYNDGSQRMLTPPFQGEIERERFKKTFIKIQEQNGLYGFVSNKVIKRDFLLRNCIYFDTNKKLAEDLDFFLSCYQKCNTFYFINECGYLYYQATEGSSVSLKNVNYDALVEIYMKLYRWLYDEALEIDLSRLYAKIQSFIVLSFMELPIISIKNVRTKLLYYTGSQTYQFLFENIENNSVLLLVKRRYYRLLFLFLFIKRLYRNGKICIIRSWRKW